MAQIGFGQAGLARFSTPGHWNDPDMLEVGNGGMNADEYRTHFALWAMLAAPLIAGSDLTKMTPETVALLTDPEAIAIDQDSAGRPGDRVSVEGAFEIWQRPLADGSKAVALFNRQELWMKGEMMSLDVRSMGLGSKIRVRDIWKKEDVKLDGQQLRSWVPSHGVLFLHISKR